MAFLLFMLPCTPPYHEMDTTMTSYAFYRKEAAMTLIRQIIPVILFQKYP